MEVGSATIQIGLAVIFILSALMKLKDMPAFLQLVKDYEVLPARMSSLYGALTPWLEIAGAVLLLFPATRLPGAVLLLLLLVSFGAAVGLVIRSGREVSCGCYGKWMESNADGFTIVKIVLLMGMIGALLLFPAGSFTVSWASALLGCAVAAVFFLLQMIWNYYQQNMKIL